MNFADAIRQAAHLSGTPLTAEPPQAEAPERAPAQAPTPALVSPAAPKTSKRTPESATVKDPIQIPMEPAPKDGNVVRLEIVLSPEQLSNLLRAVVANQHSVMTLREAAAFLRIPANKVEEMAAKNELPALNIDGKWRFAHTALEEWMATRVSEQFAYDRAVGA